MYDQWLVHGRGLGLLLLENFHLREIKAATAGPGAAGCYAAAKLCVTSALNILTQSSVTELGD